MTTHQRQTVSSMPKVRGFLHMLVSHHVAVLAPIAVKFLSVSGGVNRLLPKPALFWRAACQGRSLTNGLLLAFATRGEQVTALVFAPLIGSGPIKSQAIGFFNSRKPPRRFVHP
jgi:hypothetical protein